MDLETDLEANGTACSVSALLIPQEVNIIQALVAFLSAIVSAPINIYLFIIIIKYPSLHQRSLYLPIQIIGVEILYHLTIPIVILVSTVNNGWVLGAVMCNIAGIINDGFAMFRFSMTLVLTFDRLLSILKPFFYLKHGATVAWTHTTVMWLLTFIRMVLPLDGILQCYEYVPGFKTCTLLPACSDSCKYFTAWSFTMVVLTGIILPMVLYGMIMYVTCRIIKHQEALRTSVNDSESKRKPSTKQGAKRYVNMMNNKIKFVTLSVLLTSILGATPAVILYLASLFSPHPSKILIILNILIGRTFFNFIPLFDALAFSRHQDVRKISWRIFKKLREKLLQGNLSRTEHRGHSSEPNKVSSTTNTT